MFYTFTQNNSGGRFTFDEKRGLTHHVIVEADSLALALAKAEDIGIYFHGVSNGSDCPCCGDRWYEPWKDDGTDTPTIYGDSIDKFLKSGSMYFWMDFGKEICVHYKSGRRAWYGDSPEAKKIRDEASKKAEAEWRQKNLPKVKKALESQLASVVKELEAAPKKKARKKAKKGVKKS